MPRIRSAAAENAAQMILDKISNYELVSGDIISDSDLAVEFGMSRTPVREAMMVLIENGVLERSRTKVLVRPITLSDIIEIIDVRDAIERKVIELILEHGGLTNEELATLSSIQQTMYDKISIGDINGNFHADHEFHLTMVQCSGNQRLYDFYQKLTMQTQRLRWLAMLTPSRFAVSRMEHQNILDALKSHNLEEAQKYVHLHLENTKENYRSILSNPQWQNIAAEIKNMKN